MISVHPFALFYYLTIWVFLLVLLHPWVAKHINLLFLTCIVFTMALSLRLTPGYFTTPFFQSDTGKTMIVDNMWWQLLIDSIFHWLPFIFIIILYQAYYRHNPFGLATLNALLLVFIYIILVNPVRLYDLDIVLASCAFILGVSLYALLVTV